MDLTDMCQTFHCLPIPGSLFEQDPYYMAGMRCVMEAQTIRNKELNAPQHS